MNKSDKDKIAESWQSYSMAAGQCSNVLYNLSQREVTETTKRKIHLRCYNGNPLCNIHNRWQSCDVTTTANRQKVTCKRCLKIEGDTNGK